MSAFGRLRTFARGCFWPKIDDTEDGMGSIRELDFDERNDALLRIN